MKKTQLKNALRNIWNTKVSYLSIVMIAMLAVTAYLGIESAADAMLSHADRYFAETAFRDAEILSTMLLTEEDLNAIRATDGVADAEGSFFTGATAALGEARINVSVQSVTERINRAKLLEGRLPVAEDECALEQSVAEALGVKIGGSVSLRTEETDSSSLLRRSDFTVVGIVLYPTTYARPEILTGDRCALVLPTVFDAEQLDGCYLSAVLALETTKGLPKTGEAYAKAAKEPLAALEKLARELDTKCRKAKQIGKKNELFAQMRKAEAELEQARKELV